MGLAEEANKAQLIRNALTAFTAPCPNYALDINKTIAELTSLHVILNDLEHLIATDVNDRFTVQLEKKLKYIHNEVAWILDELYEMIGSMSGRGDEDYQDSWEQLTFNVRLSKNRSPHRTLADYRRELEKFCHELDSQYGTSPEAESPLESPRSPLARNFSYQQPKPIAPGRISPILEDFKTMSLSVQQPDKKRSYERKRAADRPMSPTDSSASSKSERTKYRDKPYAPSPPTSPIQSVSSANTSINLLESTPPHWARFVFQNLSATPLPHSKEFTRYHERHGTREQERPSDSYETVLMIEYPEKVVVKLMCRRRDYRAKIVVDYRDYRDKADYGCMALDKLSVHRDGPLLRLCRRKTSGEPVAWLTLKFTTFERLITFACTFIAMRGQQDDPNLQIQNMQDEEFRDEIAVYSSAVIDNGYRHALRIYRDVGTGCIRLQASVLGGALDRIPVWTAFITHAVMSPDWCRPMGQKTLCLADLHPHIFSERYKPSRAPNGAFKLRFEMRDDTNAFLDVIERLRLEREIDKRY